MISNFYPGSWKNCGIRMGQNTYTNIVYEFSKKKKQGILWRESFGMSCEKITSLNLPSSKPHDQLS